MEEITKRVRAARAYAGLTQEDMASRLGVSIVTFKRIEAGKRDVATAELQRISEITEMPLAFFTAELGQLAGSQQQLQEVEENLQHLVDRLSDVEFRLRRQAEGPSAE